MWTGSLRSVDHPVMPATALRRSATNHAVSLGAGVRLRGSRDLQRRCSGTSQGLVPRGPVQCCSVATASSVAPERRPTQSCGVYPRRTSVCVGNVRSVSRLKSARSVAGGLAFLRLAVGVTLTIAPRSVLKMQDADDPSGALVLMTRTVGIRDFVVGVGSVAALRSDNDGDLRRWITVGLLSDLLDVAAAASGARLVGTRGALVAALVPVPVIAADLRALSMLNANRTTTR